MRIGSLFSGYGGLEQGVQAVLGGTVAWHSEIDPGACKILAHRYPDVPNLGDITAVDWSQVEPVDVLVGGFPCQDVSSAGLRKGLRPDTRSGLWAQFAHAINQLRPALVVIENVRGLLSAEAHCDVEPCPWCVGDADGVLLRALGAVLGDLADIGYDASWQGVQACDVGAPHERFRAFVAAWPAANADSLGLQRGWRSRDGRPGPADGPVTTADAGSDRRERRSEAATSGRADGGGSRPSPAGLGAHTATHADGDAVREQPVALTGRRGATVTGLPGDHAPTDADRDGLTRVTGLPAGRDGVQLDERRDADGRADAPAHTEGDGRHEGWPESARIVRGSDPAISGAALWGPYAPAVRRWELLTRPAPAPTEPGGSGMARVREFAHLHGIDGYTAREMLRAGRWGARLSPAAVEWMQGLPAGWVTDPAIWEGMTNKKGRVLTGWRLVSARRNAQLKALGNGVVPQQAAHALRLLLADLPRERAA